MKHPKNQQMETEQTPAQQVAADFMSQYTDEDLFLIQQKSPEELKAYLQAVMASGLEFAVHILPGRPSRPQKPTI